MAKSLVERYEQLLAQDPTSSVFVELAKALLAKDEPARALEVCEQGVAHHPTSVIGHVLWGKALLQCGRPAEAMDLFDKAIALDRENPHAYNLISEVLLQRGLFRSALPILRKASALQPNNGRVLAWLEQAQEALAGGPQPLLADFTGFGTDAPAQTPAEEGSGSVSEGAPVGGDGEVRSQGEGGAPVGEEAPVAGDGAPSEAPSGSGETGATASASADDGGLSAEAGGAFEGLVASDEAEGDAQQDSGADTLTPALSQRERAFPSEEGRELSPAPEDSPARGGGLLADLPPLDDEPSVSILRAAVSSGSGHSRSSDASSSGKRSLLDDLPDLEEVEPPPAAAPQARSSTQDAAAIAAAYEKELREKLTGKPAAAPSLFARHGLRLAVASVLIVVLGVGVGAFFLRRALQGGQSLGETLDRAERLISQDTHKSLSAALEQLELAREMDDDDPRGWALTAYAHALRFVDHGGSAEDRRQALEALEKPGVRANFPGLSLATDVLVADERGREAARRALLDAQVDSAEVHALAGDLLLRDKKPEPALERFKRALSLSPRHVRALVALGRYYQDFEDFPNALNIYSRAHEASAAHPEVRIGLAETRLALEQDLKESLADMEALASEARLPASLKERQLLAQGRLLSALGRHEEARGLLARGTKGSRGFDFQLALASASRVAGRMEDAQHAYEEALRLQPKSEEALEGLGRTLLARDRVREVLSRLDDAPGRKAALVRGAAHVRLGDWKRARAELGRTRVNGRYPPEAIAYLALADAAEGNGAQAREVLEKALAATKGAHSEVRLALGQVYWRERALDKAQAQFEEAMKDARDYEGACALGRLLISRGLPDMAIKPLEAAVARNGAHGEARGALGRALLALGRADEGLAHFEAWQRDNPGSAEAQKGYSLALLHAGRFKDAAGAAERAVKLDGDDVEAHRTHSHILFALGDVKGGFAALERANKLNPKDAETFCAIAHAFLRQGNVGNAVAAFAAARREGPDVPCGRIGEHYAQPEGGRAAATALQPLAEKSPAAWDRAFAQVARARVLLAAGDVKGARAAADEAVRLAPHDARGHLALGRVALRQKQEADAKAALVRAVELDAANGMARLALADVLARSPADAARAVEEYRAFLRLAGGAPEAARVQKALPALERRAGR